MNGVYAFVDPDLDSLLRLEQIKKLNPNPCIEYCKSTEFHCTVVYSYSWLDELTISDDSSFLATVIGYERFDDVIVALLDSPSICNANLELQSQGLTHTFDPYRPHVTMGRIVIDNPNLDSFIKNMRYKPNLTFGSLKVSPLE